MSIALQTQPISANATLQAADVQALLTAIGGVVTLPTGEVATNIVSLNLVVQPSGAGVLNVRFSK
jgi:hypothetical protein